MDRRKHRRLAAQFLSTKAVGGYLPGLELDGMLDATMIAGFYLSAHRQNDGGDDDTDSGSDTDGEMMSTLIIGTGPATDWRD